MRLFIIKTAVFVFGFLLCIKLIGLLDTSAVNDQQFDLSRLKNSIRFDSLDLLFLGSSYTYSSINPLIFEEAGYRCYNLGISGTGVYFTELILEDYFKIGLLENPEKELNLIFTIRLLFDDRQEFLLTDQLLNVR